MSENILRRIQIRRGYNNQRNQVVFEEGEPVYTIDTKRVFIGDNNKYGGNSVSNRTEITNNEVDISNKEKFDLSYNDVKNCTYIVDVDNTLREITFSGYRQVKKDIDIIDALISRLSSECCMKRINV